MTTKPRGQRKKSADPATASAASGDQSDKRYSSRMRHRVDAQLADVRLILRHSPAPRMPEQMAVRTEKALAAEAARRDSQHLLPG